MKKRTKEQVLRKLLPKNNKILNGVICKVCQTKLYLKDYNNKEELKNNLIEHMINNHTDKELKDYLLNNIKG